nr:hypothetical protein [Candidatus Sigynarchaeota archaeon]
MASSGFVFLVLAMLVNGATGLLQSGDGTPNTSLAIEPVSLLIGAAGGAIAIGVPLLARSISHRGKASRKDDDCDGIASAKHTKTGHVTLLKRTPEIEQPAGKIGDSIGPITGEHKKEFKGHVTLLK